MNKPQANGGIMQSGAGDNANIPVEIVDVAPDYQRQLLEQLLGWPAEDSSAKPVISSKILLHLPQLAKKFSLCRCGDF